MKQSHVELFRDESKSDLGTIGSIQSDISTNTYESNSEPKISANRVRAHKDFNFVKEDNVDDSLKESSKNKSLEDNISHLKSKLDTLDNPQETAIIKVGLDRISNILNDKEAQNTEHNKKVLKATKDQLEQLKKNNKVSTEYYKKLSETIDQTSKTYGKYERAKKTKDFYHLDSRELSTGELFKNAYSLSKDLGKGKLGSLGTAVKTTVKEKGLYLDKDTKLLSKEGLKRTGVSLLGHTLQKGGILTGAIPAAWLGSKLLEHSAKKRSSEIEDKLLNARLGKELHKEVQVHKQKGQPTIDTEDISSSENTVKVSEEPSDASKDESPLKNTEETIAPIIPKLEATNKHLENIRDILKVSQKSTEKFQDFEKQEKINEKLSSKDGLLSSKKATVASKNLLGKEDIAKKEESSLLGGLVSSYLGTRLLSKLGKFLPKGLVTSFEKTGGSLLSKAIKPVSSVLGGATIGGLASKTVSSTEKIAAESTGLLSKAGGLLGKIGLKDGAKFVAKKLPLLGLGFGLYEAAKYAAKGDVIGALGSVASGVASTVPGAGTLVSAGIDGALMVRDVAKETNQPISEQDAKKVVEKNTTHKINDIVSQERETTVKSKRELAKNLDRKPQAVVDKTYSKHSDVISKDIDVTKPDTTRKLNAIGSKESILDKAKSIVVPLLKYSPVGVAFSAANKATDFLDDKINTKSIVRSSITALKHLTPIGAIGSLVDQVSSDLKPSTDKKPLTNFISSSKDLSSKVTSSESLDTLSKVTDISDSQLPTLDNTSSSTLVSKSPSELKDFVSSGKYNESIVVSTLKDELKKEHKLLSAIASSAVSGSSSDSDRQMLGLKHQENMAESRPIFTGDSSALPNVLFRLYSLT